MTARDVSMTTNVWIALPESMTKIIVDAAISKNTGRAAVAAIARDGAGIFQGASVLIIQGAIDPELMEAIACREVLLLAILQSERSDLLLTTSAS